MLVSIKNNKLKTIARNVQIQISNGKGCRNFVDHQVYEILKQKKNKRKQSKHKGGTRMNGSIDIHRN